MSDPISKKEGKRSWKVNLLLRIPLIGAGLAVLFGASLFAIDTLEVGGFELHSLIEGLALIFIGISFMTLCFTFCRGMDRYHWRMMMGITFCLWGIEAIMPYGLWRLLIRDAVVLLFILDLVLMILDWSPKVLKKEKYSGVDTE